MGQAVTVIVIAGVAALIGNIFRAGMTAGVIGLIGSLLGYALFSLMVFLIGTKLMPEPTTKADFNETFRVVGFAASPGVFNILAIVPYHRPAHLAARRAVEPGHRRHRRARSARLLEHRPRDHRLPDRRRHLPDRVDGRHAADPRGDVRRAGGRRLTPEPAPDAGVKRG